MNACTLLWLNWRMLPVTQPITSTISGLGSSKDWQLMATIRAQDYTFVTTIVPIFLFSMDKNGCIQE